MRIARRLMLLCAIALAATALAATNAAAQETPVEVVNEDTLEHCSVALGNCVVHAAGGHTTLAHVPFFGEVQITDCDADELTASFNEDGTGHVTAYENDHVANPNCTVEECAEVTAREWNITRPGETGPEAGHMNLHLCLFSEAQNTDIHCTIEVDIIEHHDAQGNGTHEYDIIANNDPCLHIEPDETDQDFEFTGTWTTENPHEAGVDDEIEILHP